MSYFFKATKKWRVYDDEDFRLFDKYYVHDQLFGVDVRFRSLQGKIRTLQSFQNDARGLTSSRQVNFEIPFANSDRYLYSSVSPDDTALFAYDNGLIELNKKTSLNLFSSYMTSKDLREQIYKVGFACIGDNFNYGLRFK